MTSVSTTSNPGTDRGSDDRVAARCSSSLKHGTWMMSFTYPKGLTRSAGESNSSGGPCSARPLRGLRASDAPGPRRRARGARPLSLLGSHRRGEAAPRSLAGWLVWGHQYVESHYGAGRGDVADEDAAGGAVVGRHAGGVGSAHRGAAEERAGGQHDGGEAETDQDRNERFGADEAEHR